MNTKSWIFPITGYLFYIGHTRNFKIDGGESCLQGERRAVYQRIQSFFLITPFVSHM